MPSTQMNAMSHFPRCSGKLPGHYPETPQGLPSSVSPPPFPKVPAMLLPTISQSSSLSPKALGGKMRHIICLLSKLILALIWQKLSFALFLPSLNLTLEAAQQQPKNATSLAGFPASQSYSHHKSLPPEILFQLLNWFQNEFTLNTRWLHLNGSSAKILLLIC